MSATETSLVRPLEDRLRRFGQEVVRFARHQPLGAFGAFLVLAAVVAAVFAPIIAPSDPLTVRTDQRFEPPSWEFLLGTDNYGRDIASRLLHGARPSLYVGIMSVTFGGLVGGLWGLVSGSMAGSRFDIYTQRVADALMAFPMLILALTIAATMRPSINTVVIAISIALVPQVQRVVRASAMAAREMQFVRAAEGIGATPSRIILRHILPQCVAPFLIVASAMVGQAIIVESAISFVGAGPPPPEPTWGNMLSDAARTYMREAPLLSVWPGLAISLTVFGFNLFGDALRDVLDPRLRGGVGSARRAYRLMAIQSSLVQEKV